MHNTAEGNRQVGPHGIRGRLTVQATAANPLRGEEDEMEDGASLVLLPGSA